MLGDNEIVALTVWGEARGEAEEGRIAVAHVIRNRLMAGRWGHTYIDVCRAPFQFSCWNEKDPNQPKLLAMAAKLMRGEPVVDQAFSDCLKVANSVIKGSVPSNVHNATHYYSTFMRTPPSWAFAPGAEFVCQVGNHLFYEGVV